MKVGDLVTTRSRNFIGVIIDSKIIVKIHGQSTEQIRVGGKDLYSYQVYWSSPKVEKNPVWVNERDLVRAV